MRVAGAEIAKRALNKFGEKGIELPNVKSAIGFKDAELEVIDGAIVLSGNLDANL